MPGDLAEVPDSGLALCKQPLRQPSGLCSGGPGFRANVAVGTRQRAPQGESLFRCWLYTVRTASACFQELQVRESQLAQAVEAVASSGTQTFGNPPPTLQSGTTKIAGHACARVAASCLFCCNCGLCFRRNGRTRVGQAEGDAALANTGLRPGSGTMMFPHFRSWLRGNGSSDSAG